MDKAMIAKPVNIPIAIARTHVHLTASAIEVLFGDDYCLHKDEALNQAHQFMAMESVTLVGPRRRLSNVHIIGPPRAVNQVELSRTDAESLGIQAPVRASGDLIGTPGITIEGPRTRVVLGTGVICAQRHIHMNPMEAKQLGVKDQDRVSVSTGVSNRGLQFRNVLIRVSPGYKLELHLDTDEANAAGIREGDYAVLDQITAHAAGGLKD